MMAPLFLCVERCSDEDVDVRSRVDGEIRMPLAEEVDHVAEAPVHDRRADDRDVVLRSPIEQGFLGRCYSSPRAWLMPGPIPS